MAVIKIKGRKLKLVCVLYTAE